MVLLLFGGKFMSLFKIEKQEDGSVFLHLFNKKKCLFHIPCKYTKLYSKRFKGLTREEIKYLLEIQFKCMVGYNLNLDNPKTYNEKIQWLKFNYHNPLLTKCADKVKAREYIKETIGEQYLVPCLGVYNTPDEIDFDKLPNQFVLKVNWGCKQNIIVKDKSKLSVNDAKMKLKNWLKPESNHYYYFFEWQYKDIKPKIICEKYIVSDKYLKDYKFHCCNGKFKRLLIIGAINEKKRFCNFYDKNLNLLNLKNGGTIKQDEKVDLNNYSKMVELAEKLAKPFPVCRVDFYEDINKDIYVGELTFTPGNGTDIFEPFEWDYKLGEDLILPKLNNLD
jgi:hypothetical protein